MNEKTYKTFSSVNVREFPGDYDPTSFFYALKLFSNEYEKAILYIESTAIDAELLKMFEAHKSPIMGLINKGTIWPKSKKLHLTLSEELIDQLIKISNIHAVPEYADHIVLYDSNIILEAYDFTQGIIQMDSGVSSIVAQEFRKHVNSGGINIT